MKEILKYSLSMNDLKIELEAENCLNNYKANSCRKCLSICPKQALSLNNQNQISLSKKCDSCGLCLSVCPTECFSTTPSFVQTLLLKLNKDFPAILNCQKSNQKDSIKLKCLASLNESTLFLTAASSSSVHLIADTCHKCDIAKEALPLMRKKVQIANNLLKVIDMPPFIKIFVQAIELEKKIRRQDFFKVAAKEALKLSLSNLPKNEGYGGLLPNRRLLLNQLKNKHFKNENENLPFYDISTSEECDLCLKCPAFCPTKALATNESNEVVSLLLKRGFCIGCGLCLKGCPKNSLSIKPLTDLPKLFAKKTLREDKLVPCQICGMMTSQKSAKCNRCLKEASLNKSLASLFE